MKKNLWKIMAALMVIALPFVVASCGSDDEDNGPKTYNWSWTLQNTTLGNNATTAEKSAALEAEGKVNALFATIIKAQDKDFKVDAQTQKFSVETENEPNLYDNKVKAAVFSMLSDASWATMVEPLPASAKIVVKRGSTVVIENKLK